MILIITGKKDRHANFVIDKMEQRGVEYVRLNAEDFPQRVSIPIQNSLEQNGNYLVLPNEKCINLKKVKSVWYRKPLPPDINEITENQRIKEFILKECNAFLGGLWEMLDCLWVNRPSRIKIANYKSYQLQLAKEIGFEIPSTIITNNPEAVRKFYNTYGGNIVVKTLWQTLIEQDNKVFAMYTKRVNLEMLEKLNSLHLGPAIFQEKIEKKFELRVIVIGEKIFACEIHSQESERTKEDWRRYDFTNVPHRPHALPLKISNLCITMIKRLGLSFGAFDLILTPDGHYIFLEINPNGQWGWIELLTGLPISTTLIDFLLNQSNLKSARN